MGTKLNPGKFDCYAKAAPDEPLFTLRAKDPSAPYFVRAWAFLRQGRVGQALVELKLAGENPDVQALVSSDGYEKLTEAHSCADEMTDWRLQSGHAV